MLFVNWEDKRKWLEERDRQKNSPEQLKLDAETEEAANEKLKLLQDIVQLGAMAAFSASVQALQAFNRTPQEAEAQRVECVRFWQAYCFVVTLPIAGIY